MSLVCAGSTLGARAVTGTLRAGVQGFRARVRGSMLPCGLRVRVRGSVLWCGDSVQGAGFRAWVRGSGRACGRDLLLPGGLATRARGASLQV